MAEKEKVPDDKFPPTERPQRSRSEEPRSTNPDAQEDTDGTQQPTLTLEESSVPQRRHKEPKTIVLVPPIPAPGFRESHYSSSFGTTVTEREGGRFRTIRVGPYETTKENVKVNITVLGKRKLPHPPPPASKHEPSPPIPVLPQPKPVPKSVPTPVPKSVPIPPPPVLKPEPAEKPPSRSQAVLDYLDSIAGLSQQDLEHDVIPSPEFANDTIDVVELLSKFGVPDQAKALDSLLDSDAVDFDFGKLMRQYYSYVLRSYCLINMQDRYRGANHSAACLTSIDLSRILTGDEEMERQTKLKLRKLEEKREKLRIVARDEDHFEYLKSLAHNQPSLIPLTIVHMMNEQMAPPIEDIFRYYGKNLGTDHSCTKEAGFHYMKIRKRCEMYNNICGGSTLNEDLTLYYK